MDRHALLLLLDLEMRGLVIVVVGVGAGEILEEVEGELSVGLRVVNWLARAIIGGENKAQRMKTVVCEWGGGMVGAGT